MNSYSEQTRLDGIMAKFKDVAAKAHHLYGVNLSNAPVSFSLRGRVAGWATCKICAGEKQVGFRFNRDLIMGKHYEDMLNSTIPHELAHGVCFLRPELGSDHDSGWKRVCISLGGTGDTKHNFEVQYVGGSFDYITSTGKKVTISKHRHTKIQTGGMAYRFRDGGRINKASKWCHSGETMPDIEPITFVSSTSSTKSREQLLQEAIVAWRKQRQSKW